MTRLPWGASRPLLIGLAAFDAALLLGFLIPTLHHPVALVVSPLVGVGMAPAIERWSRRRVLLAIGLVLVLIAPLMVSPSFVARLV